MGRNRFERKKNRGDYTGELRSRTRNKYEGGILKIRKREEEEEKKGSEK